MVKPTERLMAIGTAKSKPFNFFDPKNIHDRILLVEGKKFYIQSGLLMVWSEFFQGLFGKDFKEANMKEIEIKDVSAEDFENFLKLIYPGEFVITVSNYLSLANLADRFLAPYVAESVNQFMIKNFASLDKIEFLKFAFQHDKKELKDLIAIFIGAQLGRVITDEWTCDICKMPRKTPPFCAHPKGTAASFVNSWIHSNIVKIRELSPELQCFILSASVGKY